MTLDTTNGKRIKDQLTQDNTPYPIEIKETADGSRTLYIPQLQESYHSTYGARVESEYIYIQQALMPHESKDLNVFEVGFGTGLNALLTWQYAEQHQYTIHYDSIELYPLSASIVHQIYEDRWDSNSLEMSERLHQAPWNSPTALSSHFTITKLKRDLLSITLPESKYHSIYMDAFAPDIVPEQWTEEVLSKLYQSQVKGGVLSTYCAKGVIRRRLQAIGYRVERTEGPPNGKREILVCHKEN